jgi:protein-S-isoprenylcysteine O-methyltransferase Ste14
MALQEEFESQGNWLFRYRSFLPLIILVIGWMLYLRRELHPEEFPLYNPDLYTYFLAAGLAVGLLGLLIRVYTVGHTPKNTSGRNTKEGQVADTLNQTGIYSLVRHPLYLGNFLMWLGPAVFTGHVWFIVGFSFMYWVYYERIMFAEEQFLRKKFGPAYLTWSEKVPAFIPKFSGFKSPEYPFSWKKVLKKEKNGVFALFFVFCLFDVSGELIQNQQNFNKFLLSMSGFTGVSYLFLKVIKKNTKLLNEEDR